MNCYASFSKPPFCEHDTSVPIRAQMCSGRYYQPKGGQACFCVCLNYHLLASRTHSNLIFSLSAGILGWFTRGGVCERGRKRKLPQFPQKGTLPPWRSGLPCAILSRSGFPLLNVRIILKSFDNIALDFILRQILRNISAQSFTLKAVFLFLIRFSF